MCVLGFVLLHCYGGRKCLAVVSGLVYRNQTPACLENAEEQPKG